MSCASCGAGAGHAPGCAQAATPFMGPQGSGGCGGSGQLRTLTARQAAATLAQRFVPLADRMRQKLTDFGLRPYATYLTWTRWSGELRGEGRESLERRIALVPNPMVEDLTAVALQPYAAGVLPTGSVKISRVSPRYPQDLLMGLVMPCDPQASLRSQLAGGSPVDPMTEAIATESVPEPWEFFYEVVEDGRSNQGRPARRERFRPLAAPFLDAGALGWTVVLERVSRDMARDGAPDDD